MEMEKKTAEALKALAEAMNRNQCYACAHEFVEIVNDFGSNILLEAACLLEKQDAIAMMKEQEAVVAHWDDDTGHWIEGDRNGIDPHTRTTGEMIDTFRCSWCGFYQYWKTPFCPNCGAKMKQEGR